MRRPYPAGAAALLVLAAATSAGAQTRTIQGTVRDSASGETLPYATVYITEARLRATTNTDGRFVLLGVPDGQHILRVRYLGYRPLDLPFEAQRVIAPLSITMARAAVELPGVTVTAEEQNLDVTQHVSLVSLSPAQIAVMPALGEVDIFRALQLLPGVRGTDDGSASLFVRGGTPDQNLVLLDGMTVYHVDHFFGLFSAFNADAIKSVRLYQGGYPAQYGGRVSSVLDLTGKTGDERRFRVSAGANLLSARGVAEIPLGKGSWLISGRRSYTDLIRSPLYEKLFGFRRGETNTPAQPVVTTTPAGGGRFGGPGGRVGGPGGGGRGGQLFNRRRIEPSFYFDDLNSKATYRPSGQDMLSLSVYHGRDHLDQSFTVPDQTGTGTIGGATDVTTWGNVGASGRWFRQWHGRVSTDLLLAGSRYTSDGNLAANTTAATGPGLRLAFTEKNRVDDLTLRLDNELLLAQTLRVGFGTWVTANQVSYDYQEALRDTTRRGISRAAQARQTAGYVQQTWSPFRRFELTTGLRATHYDLARVTYVEPRASLGVSVTPEIRLKAAWGRYHQFVNRIENEDVLQGSRDFWLLADTSLRPTGAEHVIAGASYERGAYVVDVEAYRKDYDDLALFSRRYRRGLTVDYGRLFFTGTGRARGIEFLVQRKYGRLTGWTSYTLADVTYTFPEVNGGSAFPANQDQRHELKTVATLALGRWTLSGTWLYGSGRAYTAPESQYEIPLLDGRVQSYIHVSDKNAYRLPPYHRLDLGAFRRFGTEGSWNWELGISLFNVYNRQNIWYRQFDVSQTPITITDVNLLGFTPSIDLRVMLK